MVRSRMSLWMRGVAFGSIAALSGMLAGCMVGSADLEPNTDELTAEAESQLDKGATSTPVTPPVHTSDIQDPEPDPWHPRQVKDSDPRDPNTIRTKVTTTPGGGNHDEN